MSPTDKILRVRSALSFLFLTVFASVVTAFLLQKIDAAIAEIETLNTTPVFLMRKEYSTEDGRSSGLSNRNLRQDAAN